MDRGKFIVLEGPEGSGKTTQIQLLAKRLAEQGRIVHMVREPGGTSIGETIRHVLLDSKNSMMTVGTELMLYMACRVQLVHEKIRPALEKGEFVLADRFLTSTIVYQGIAGGLGADEVRRLYRLVCGDVEPDLVVVLDLPAEDGLQRINGKRIKHIHTLFEDRIEGKPIEFHQEVRKGYLVVAEADPSHYAIVNAQRSPERVAEAIWREVSRVLS